MKASEVMKEHVKWLKDRCKHLKRDVEKARTDQSIWYENTYVRDAQMRLDECVAIKVATEKYMKKLRHEGN
jgi:hypothetical protein